MREDNIVLTSDIYKTCHHKMLDGIEKVYSYLEARKLNQDIVFFWTSISIETIFSRQGYDTQDKINYAASRIRQYVPGQNVFNRDEFGNTFSTNTVGRLPVEIKTVPEGSVVNSQNCLLTIVNTDDRCAWLTNYLETLLCQLWYPCSVATYSRNMKKIINNSLRVTGNPDELNFKLCDFGYRGVSSVESAGIGGGAHLVNFEATDNIAGLEFVNEYYGGGVYGSSIPATEHSVMVSDGPSSESNRMSKFLDEFPNGLIACVSDSLQYLHGV